SDHLTFEGQKQKVHSLVEKVYSRKNLTLAWERVRANRGAGGYLLSGSREAIHESGMRENCTFRLSGGRRRALQWAPPPTRQLRSRRTKRSNPPRSRWSQGRGPRGTWASKARAGRRTGKVCHRRWNAYDKPQGKGRRRSSRRSCTMSTLPC